MVMHKLKKKNLETGLYVTTEQVDGERLPCKTKSNNVYVLDTYSTPNYLNIFEENYSKEIALVVIVKNYESFLYEFRGYKSLFKTLTPVKKPNPVEIYKKIDKNEEGIKISFFPKIFDSIHTSLDNPQKYLSEEKTVHKIYKILMEEEATLSSLSKKFKVCIKETVKSMLYAQIIQLKNGKYFINPKLQIYK